MPCRFLSAAILFVAGLSFITNSLVAADSSSSSGSAPDNSLSSAEKAAGWKLLFDGKTTNGWRSYRKKGVEGKWKVVDGVLTGQEGSGDIITIDEFGAFELVLDYKIPKGGNSGVMFHVTEEGKYSFESGPEVQIYDHPGGPDVQKTGFVYALYDSKVDSTKPAGEWNQMRLLITPEKCETYINGVKYNEYVIGSDDWNARVAKSKYNEVPIFAKKNRGFICLQEHGNGVEFKNIKVRVVGEK